MFFTKLKLHFPWKVLYNLISPAEAFAILISSGIILVAHKFLTALYKILAKLKLRFACKVENTFLLN